MLNLSEEWKKAYESFLEAEEKAASDELDTLFEELMAARNESMELLEAVQQYINLSSATLTEAGNGGVGIYVNGENTNANDERLTSGTSELLQKMMTLVPEYSDNDKRKSTDYIPTATYSVQKISDMKFPQNLIFFIQQLIKWISNIVLFFIEKIKNIIRRLLGDHSSVTKIDYDKLKLDLTKAQKVESTATTLSVGNNDKFVRAWKVNGNDVVLAEGLTDFILKKEEKENKERVVITLDFSRDIESLKILAEHFFNLFDNAYGSFNEKLFDTSDLEVVLKIFKQAIKRVETGDPATEMLIGGASSEVEMVSVSAVRGNLINTNTNIENLKKAYVETNNKIKDIAKVVSNKQLLALTDLGVSRAMLSSSTIRQLMPLVQAIPARLKEAKEIEKNLSRVKSQYEKLTKELQKLQRGVASVSNITYTTVYARRVNDLFQASRYMSDIITLRLAGLTLYMKELRDLRDVITQIAGAAK